MDCPHPGFDAEIVVTRIEEALNGQVEGTGFIAEVRIACSACHEPFRFIGLPAGFDIARPTTTGHGAILLAPIAPHAAPVLAEHAQFRVPSRLQPH